MKKFSTIILLIGFSISGFCSAKSNADLQAEIVQLKEQIAKLEIELQSANEKYVKQIKDDMAILSKLREENRSLKRQLRASKRIARAEKNLSSTVNTTSVKSESSTVKKTEVKTVKASGEVSKKVESVPEVKKQEPKLEAVKKSQSDDAKKSDSVWDHMFPF